jgi:hypothetical protein
MDEPNIPETYFKRMRWEKIGFPRSQALADSQEYSFLYSIKHLNSVQGKRSNT